MQEALGTPYNLAVKIVLLDHNNVHGLGVLESQESESSRPTRRTISHNSTLSDFAKLREIVS